MDEYSNIYVLGAKPYKELPSYIKDIDILTIPFVLNDITASTSPVKLFEYMAAAKPIITSDMIECRRYDSVKIYHDKDELVKLIDEIINLEGDEREKYFKMLSVDAQNNTWKQRTEQIMNALYKKEK